MIDSVKITKIIKKLNRLAANRVAREQKAITNLIGRIEFFYESGDEDKLSTCIGEANLWGARA